MVATAMQLNTMKWQQVSASNVETTDRLPSEIATEKILHAMARVRNESNAKRRERGVGTHKSIDQSQNQP
jgi:hypothetical protein